MTISNKTLMKIASIGGIITCTTGLLYQWKLKDRIRASNYYKEAFQTLRSHPGAVRLLGEPINEGNFNLKNPNIYHDNDKVHLEVYLTGSKQKGSLYLWASKHLDDKWSCDRIELGLESEPDRRLLIKNNDNNDNNQ